MPIESIDELAALARELRESTLHLDASGPVLDTTGTGGDGFKTINFSTLAALVAAAAGVQVAKQNRPAISSACGSTDFLREMGVAYDLPPDAAAACLRETGICFLFSPLYHPGLIASSDLTTQPSDVQGTDLEGERKLRAPIGSGPRPPRTLSDLLI